MVALDYNTVIRHQYEDVNKSRKKFHILSYFNFFRVIRRKITEKLNSVYSKQLIFSRGLVAEFTDHAIELEHQDLSSPIDLIEDLIKINIFLKNELDKSNDPEFLKLNQILSETIEQYYTVLRILKRNNKKKNIETSQLAKDCCTHSLNSLQTVINGRRTT